VDGLRFVVPVRTINAGPSPKYFAKARHHLLKTRQVDQIAGSASGRARHAPGLPVILDVLLNSSTPARARTS